MSKKGFAYFDQYGILHVTESEATAARFGDSNYLEVNIPYGGGYPLDSDGNSIFVYERGKEIRIGNRNNKNGRVIKPEQVPQVASIIKKLNEE